MTAGQLENYVTRLLGENGWWALRIPRNPSGAQPFDIIAVKGSKVLALDCKACSEPKFPIKRVEDNQWTAFAMMSKRTDAVVGIVAEYKEVLYFISYEELVNVKGSYLGLTDERLLRWLNVSNG